MPSVSSLARSLALGVVCALLLSVAPVRAVPPPGTADEIGRFLRTANKALASGNYLDAESEFKRALAADPASRDAATGLAWTYMKLRRFGAAFDAASAYLAIAPDDARAMSLVGFALMRTGRLREAADAFLKAVGRDPNEPFAVAGLAEILFFSGSIAESQRFAEHAVRLRRDEPDFLFLLGQVASRNEQFEEAAQVYELFLATAPKMDKDRRARIKAVIDFCRALVGKKLYLRSGPTSVSLPLEFSNSRLPLVRVTVDGEGPFRFAIDTGAAFTVISDDLASRLKIRPVAKGGTSQGVGGGGKFPLVYGLLRSIGLGDIRLENVPTYIRKSHQDPTDPIDGYIGLAILSRFLSAVDFGAGRLELVPADSQMAELGPEDVELTYQVTGGGMMSVPTEVGAERPLNFVIDTGASSSVVSSDAFERYGLGAKLDVRAQSRVVGAAGVTESVPVVVIDRLSARSVDQTRELRRDAVRALVLDLAAVNETAGFEVAGIIGGNVLRHYRVELDAGRGRLVLRPTGKPTSD